MNNVYDKIVYGTQKIEKLSEEFNIIFETFKTCSDTYDEFYENSREGYVTFVNFAPSVKQKMLEVDKWLQM
jgi:hypothetical protein